ncbi:helix-turn-helix domain-containing protein [Marinilactibacillus sp. XAAS-LB27]|uniref:helix-turn-helix domain-containing protein n=1 Tax=Marinilactibacillus sp. XAAS-LB27 TaxID=3114538 RepID=UPI002E186D3E|nr:helix-turn-helix domain-containing protein [Marinilactibacillus sp. XAAS-LB27]
MATQNRYFLYFLLSFFNNHYPSKSSQLIHVFHGRRTPSILFKVENEQLFPAFGLFKELKKEHLEHYLQKLCSKNLLQGSEEEGYLLTSLGYKSLTQYFENKKYPEAIRSLENATLRNSFYLQIQLVSQIFSEKRYDNKKYSPSIKEPSDQESVKAWLSKQKKPMDQLALQWATELYDLLLTFAKEEASMIVGKLTGHDIIGKTNRQLAESLEMESVELNVRLSNTFEQLIIQARASEGLLLNDFVTYLDQRTYFGLSKSTYDTYLMVNEGYSVEQISEVRQLKLNTIREHILEIYLVHPDFNFQPYIPADQYERLKMAFEQNPKYSYKQAKQDYEDLMFMWFRLVEIERIRYGRENARADTL